jgi:hypothetical protein
VGAASDAIDAVELIDAVRAAGCFSSAGPQVTSASMGSCPPAWGVHVRQRLVEALREVSAVYARGLLGAYVGLRRAGPPPRGPAQRARRVMTAPSSPGERL